MSTHHPDEVLLMEYSAGTLSEPMALCMRMHLDRCSQCRGQLDMLNSLGAIMLDHSQQASRVSDDLFDNIVAQIDSEPAPREAETEKPSHDSPLERLLGSDLQELPWKRQLADVSVYDLSDRFPGDERVTLQKLCAGGRAPSHSHHGSEATLVLTGAFADANGVFSKGDFVILDHHHDHQPVALHGEDCITLSVMDAPVKLTGRLTRLLNPFIR
ncbi:anti-sigma factor [Halovibrio salipaludis]|uniref:Anti-sigma factor n=1 Tax=Halovibrio salipaludis TaxID=2032626 RepID=A0A2A2FBU3_9GAMM|nr:ChrR family anti-sigma-E factor [Halovibrio salipaludis]PAU82310.1 anti-sigma factor [Halovibrio salipaludis]